MKAALLPRILPLDRILGRVTELSRNGPDAPSPELPGGTGRARRQFTYPPDATPLKVEEDAPASEGTQPPGGLRFKAIIPFKRMDEDEARTYEDQDDERIHKFRETAAKRLPSCRRPSRARPSRWIRTGSCTWPSQPRDATGGTLLNNRERREALEAVARESGLPGPVAVETSARPEPERSLSRASSARSDPPVSDRRDPLLSTTSCGSWEGA